MLVSLDYNWITVGYVINGIDGMGGMLSSGVINPGESKPVVTIMQNLVVVLCRLWCAVCAKWNNRRSQRKGLSRISQLRSKIYYPRSKRLQFRNWGTVHLHGLNYHFLRPILCSLALLTIILRMKPNWCQYDGRKLADMKLYIHVGLFLVPASN